ncbi:cytochrome c oxidase subunit 3 [Sinobacterium caligoides]|uniref:cytochrome-c oxidase n=1 Tax=Sinobacterium caligoides TaxID=933926 RepID=A0A3N2DH81_9GAMM|nr:cytochrome c oxidase subunit 3 [Sinobacterium caligoides]ROR98978.1 cytochrome c oxidase subunit 3 [Sinobacterium caligoides]
MTDHHAEASETYYVPEQSRLAICLAVSVAIMVVGVANGINSINPKFVETASSYGWLVFFGGLALFLATLFAWFRVTIIEQQQGLNSRQLKHSYVLGMQWFIFSEVMFFVCFFGVLWYARNLSLPWLAGEGVGALTNEYLWRGFEYSWPMSSTPQEVVGISNQPIANNGQFSSPGATVDPWHLPLLNTLLLLTSSITIHVAHTALKANKRSLFNFWLALSLVLGFAFVAFQIVEYVEAYNELGLTLSSGIYGSTFFILTGFHGFHVCLGALMLAVQWLRSTTRGDFSAEEHFGFEASSWYWHFVDVVWLGLFLFVYIL